VTVQPIGAIELMGGVGKCIEITVPLGRFAGQRPPPPGAGGVGPSSQPLNDGGTAVWALVLPLLAAVASIVVLLGSSSTLLRWGKSVNSGRASIVYCKGDPLRSI